MCASDSGHPGQRVKHSFGLCRQVPKSDYLELAFYTNRLSRMLRATNQDAECRVVLSASEIGAYVFCPEAWYLQRIGADRSAAAEERLVAGRQAHQHIGRQTDRLRDLDRGRRWLLVIVAVLVVLLLLQVVGQAGMPHL